MHLLGRRQHLPVTTWACRARIVNSSARRCQRNLRAARSRAAAARAARIAFVPVWMERRARRKIRTGTIVSSRHSALAP
ncbi:MAG: hypothetical protein L6R19_04345 [Alphaproteobacteria bacterium]|nr:hypothetical protein [Alphaproteobacteria bacterium]